MNSTDAELNRGARRRLKRMLKLPKTPSREEASRIVQYAPRQEPVKVRVKRAFSND